MYLNTPFSPSPLPPFCGSMSQPPSATRALLLALLHSLKLLYCVCIVVFLMSERNTANVTCSPLRPLEALVETEIKVGEEEVDDLID